MRGRLLGIALVFFAALLGIVVGINIERWGTPKEAISATPPAPEAGAQGGESTQPSSEEMPLSFQADILSLFKNNCLFCHGTMGGLSLSDYQVTLGTGLHRPVIIPGAPEDSLLYQRLVQEPYMPPGAPLSQKDIDKVKRWIAEGAKDN